MLGCLTFPSFAVREAGTHSVLQSVPVYSPCFHDTALCYSQYCLSDDSKVNYKVTLLENVHGSWKTWI